MMKHTLAITAMTFLSISFLAACQSKPQKSGEAPVSTAEQDQLKVVTTIFPQYDFTRQIAGDKADVIMLLQPGAESHSYEPTPQDIKNIQDCDLFIYVGGENDVWVDDILDSMGAEKPDTLKLLDCVPTVAEELVEGMKGSHGEGGHEEHAHGEEGHEAEIHEEVPGEEVHGKEVHGEEARVEVAHEEAHEEEIDEHVWTSPKNVIEIVRKITERMSEKDAENAETYEANSTAYIEQLMKLDASFREVVDSAERKTILFGDRFPFRYFADAYGLNYYAAFTGCSTETEASAATVAFLVDKVKEEQLPVVFDIELSTGKIAESICEATGARKLTLYSCHNITKDQMEAGVTYLSMMTDNVESLRTALNESLD